MGLPVSRTISHAVQQQTYNLDMEIKILHNTGNLILKKNQSDAEYTGSVKIRVAGKTLATSDKIEEGETLGDMCNRLTKLAMFKLADNLYPSTRVSKLTFKEQESEGKV